MRTALFLSPCPLLRKKGKTGMEDADEGCGIFPENLAFPEASAAGPS